MTVPGPAIAVPPGAVVSGAASPLLRWDGAVAATAPDQLIAWHYGDPLGEQRRATTQSALHDQSNRDVVTVSGPERLSWLHAICSQHLSALEDGQSTQALVLSPNGHVEQHWRLTELGGKVWIDTEPGAGQAVTSYLQKMRFLKQVEIADETADWAVLTVLGPTAAEAVAAAGLPVPVGLSVGLPGAGIVRPTAEGFELLLPRQPGPAGFAEVADRLRLAGATPIGSWGAAALRIVRREPRLGLDTDHRTLAHEAGWIGSAVHLDKGCYRGQETVARVQNLGRPPRRLAMLWLSGDSDQLPEPGTSIERDGRSVGFLGTAAHHHEFGPIALAMIKRSIGPDDRLTVAGEPVTVDPSDTAEAAIVEGFAGHVISN